MMSYAIAHNIIVTGLHTSTLWISRLFSWTGTPRASPLRAKIKGEEVSSRMMNIAASRRGECVEDRYRPRRGEKSSQFERGDAGL